MIIIIKTLRILSYFMAVHELYFPKYTVALKSYNTSTYVKFDFYVTVHRVKFLIIKTT